MQVLTNSMIEDNVYDEINNIYQNKVIHGLIKPITKFKKDGKSYTEKFKKFNRDIIKEGLTYKYVDKDVLFERTNDGKLKKTFIKYKTLKSGKIVKLPKFRKIKTLGNIILNDNFENDNDSKYIKQITKELKIKKTIDESIVKVDLKKMSLNQVLNIIGKSSTKDYFKLAQVDGTPHYISLSSVNINRLQNYEDLRGDGYAERMGSDNQFILNLDRNPVLNIISKKIVKKQKPQGAFFKYYHKLNNLDLSRYDIFSSKPKRYGVNCLYKALKEGGLELKKLNELKSFVRSGTVPCSKLNEICDRICIRLTLRKLKTDNTIATFHYGKNGDNYDIGLLDNHYFIYEKTNITSYSLKNYNDIKDEHEWWKIDKKSRDITFINSFKVIKLLLENKEELLNPIPIEDMMETQYSNEMIDNDDLDYDEDTCLGENGQIDGNIYDKVVYFDFETDTTTKTHTPYLMCALTEDNVKFEAYGHDCGRDFILWLKAQYGKGKIKHDVGIDKGMVQTVMIVAHNMRYDFTFILSYIQCAKPLLKGTSLMGGSGRLYLSEGRFIELVFMDSYNLIASKLSGFGKMFNLEQGKEVMPYSLYSTENIETQFISKEICLSHIKEEDHDQFLENVNKWDCIDEDYEIDIIEYSKRYCEIDCLVLKNGLETFGKWIFKVTGLNVMSFCSMASLGLDYLISQECFVDCYKLSGRPRDFIQKSVVGGRCMTKDNKKWEVSGQIDDFDAVSLYPSAMARMEGFLKGKPKVIKNKTFDWLKNNSDGFFVKVLALNNPTINRDFPLLSNFNGEVRNFSNNTKGNEYYIDKTTYEDCVKYQGLEFKIICGYYYDEGRNNTINDVIKHLFEARLEAKKNKNPIQAIYKLLMNSCYGKCLLKPIDSETEIVYNENFDKYLSYNYNFIKDIVDCGDCKVIKKIKATNKHFNNVYAGVEVLSMSKRIMNEVICLGEDMGLNIYYQDTDSMHINSAEIKNLSDEFEKRNGRKLIGKNMGQFHSDFDLNGATNNIHATKSFFLGKKCYIDELIGNDDNGNNIEGLHIRMKGINLQGIEHYCEVNKISVMDMYEELYTNDKLPNNGKFDLLAGGKAIKFKYNPDMSVCSVGEFKRSVNFNSPKGVLVI